MSRGHSEIVTRPAVPEACLGCGVAHSPTRLRRALASQFLSMGLPEGPHQLVAGFSQSKWSQRSWQKPQFPLWPHTRSHTPWLPPYFLGHFPSDYPNYCGENKLERGKIWGKSINFGSFLLLHLFFFFNDCIAHMVCVLICSKFFRK